MSASTDPKLELLNKTADFYRRSLADYTQFAKTENKPRSRRQLERRLQAILEEIASLATPQPPL